MEHSKSLGVRILVPQHVSAVPPSLDPSSTLVLRVWEHPGVAWRGLAPLLLDAPHFICCRLLTLIVQRSNNSLLSNGSLEHGQRVFEDENGDADKDSCFLSRHVRVGNFPKATILLNPPTVVHPDYLFTSLVLRTEHLFIKRQTLTAWWSTLGGGYFFCKRLRVSLQLARQQKALALQIGNVSMARQCQVNEAYNLIYAGKFRAAKHVLDDLEQTCEEGSVALSQCHAARLFAKRLKHVKRQGLKGYNTYEKGEKHTVDDYQRIRIVVA